MHYTTYAQQIALRTTVRHIAFHADSMTAVVAGADKHVTTHQARRSNLEKPDAPTPALAYGACLCRAVRASIAHRAAHDPCQRRATLHPVAHCPGRTVGAITKIQVYRHLFFLIFL